MNPYHETGSNRLLDLRVAGEAKGLTIIANVNATPDNLTMLVTWNVL